MSENAPEAPRPGQTEVWHVDFHMSIEPDSLSPVYIRTEVSRRVPNTDPAEWHFDGIASFDAPAMVIPRAGAPLIPYLLYHLEEFKRWLTVEHVTGELNGTAQAIGHDVGVVAPPTPAWKPVVVE